MRSKQRGCRLPNHNHALRIVLTLFCPFGHLLLAMPENGRTATTYLGTVPALGRAGDEDLADGVVGVSAAEGVQAVLALHEAVVHAEGCKSVGGLG